MLFQLSARYSLCTAVGVDLIKVELLDAPIGGINLDGIFIGRLNHGEVASSEFRF